MKISFFQFLMEVKKNINDTLRSQAVTHLSTNSARCCLTSVIGRELVFSTWCGRCREPEPRRRLLDVPRPGRGTRSSRMSRPEGKGGARRLRARRGGGGGLAGSPRSGPQRVRRPLGEGPRQPAERSCTAGREPEQRAWPRSKKGACQRHSVFPGSHPSKY